MTLAISAVVVVRDEEKRIRPLITSLLGGDLVPFEVLVVDNGSTDLTQFVVQSLAKDFPEIRLRWLATNENNLGKARALGVQEAAGEFILFLDADAECSKTAVAELWRGYQFYQKRFCEVAGVGPRILSQAAKSSFAEWYSGARTSILAHGGSPQAKLYESDQEVDHLPTTCALFSRQQLLTVGNFNSDHAKVGEDLEIGWRLRSRGLKLFVIASAAVTHHQDPSIFSWVERMLRFGGAQAEVALNYSVSLHLRFWLACAFIVIFSSALLLALSNPQWLLVNLTYFWILTAESLRLALWQRKAANFTGYLLFFIITHFAYSFGALLGLKIFLIQKLKVLAQRTWVGIFTSIFGPRKV